MRIHYSSESALPHQVAPGLFLHLPGDARFEGVELDGALFDVTLTLDMTPEGVRPVTVKVDSHRDGPPVTGTTLRAVKVSALVQHALTTAVDRGRATMTETGGYVDVVGRAVELSDEDAERIRAQGPIDESLEVVARFYNLAGLLGLPPAKQVEVNLGLPRTTASKWIRKAREKGLIGEPVTGQRSSLPRSSSEPDESDTEYAHRVLKQFGFEEDDLGERQ